MLINELTPQQIKKYRQVKAMLALQGIEEVAIARQLKVSPAAVTRTMRGQIISKRMREAIANALDKPYERVWGKGKEAV